MFYLINSVFRIFHLAMAAHVNFNLGAKILARNEHKKMKCLLWDSNSLCK